MISGDQIITLSVDVSAILIPALAGWGIAYLNKKIGSEKISQAKDQIETRQGLAWDAVNFVEQAYKDLDGPAKFQKAAEWLAKEAKNIGIAMTADQIKGVIESAVKLMKNTVQAKI